MTVQICGMLFLMCANTILSKNFITMGVRANVIVESHYSKCFEHRDDGYGFEAGRFHSLLQGEVKVVNEHISQLVSIGPQQTVCHPIWSSCFVGVLTLSGWLAPGAVGWSVLSPSQAGSLA